MAPEETLEDEDLVHVLMGLYLVLILLLGVGFFTWGVQVGLGVETVSVVSDIWSINLP